MILVKRIGLVLGSAVIALLCAGYAAAQRPNALPTTREVPDAFGTGSYTVTTISATAFTPRNSFMTWYTATSGIYSFSRYCGINAVCDFYTSLDLPAGAVIDFIGLNSNTDDAPFVVSVNVVRRDKFGNFTVIGAVDSTVHGWDTDRNFNPIGYLWNGRFDEALMIHVQAIQGGNNAQAFGWVEVWWKRSVSPAPGVASFNDVPTSHQFFQFIEALKASGITGGCQAAPPLYCPDAALTRGQMAVFLSKALGLHWPAN